MVWAIIEDPNSRNGLPDHWTESSEYSHPDYRIMDTFETEDKAEKYLESMYGMYAKDAKITQL